MSPWSASSSHLEAISTLSLGYHFFACCSFLTDGCSPEKRVALVRVPLNFGEMKLNCLHLPAAHVWSAFCLWDSLIRLSRAVTRAFSLPWCTLLYKNGHRSRLHSSLGRRRDAAVNIYCTPWCTCVRVSRWGKRNRNARLKIRHTWTRPDNAKFLSRGCVN